tara:strand:- start:17007 stop:17273 length:267 start_codon:yes stop_codon:yes gene_type:complete
MFRIFRKLVLGGRSDKREGSWFIFFIVNAILVMAVFSEARGIDLPQTWAFLIIAWPASLTAVIGVHVQHFHAEAKSGRRVIDEERGDF